MAIFPGGKSTAISSPRHLTLRHARRSAALHRVASGTLPAEEAPLPVLKPGEEKLNSFWAPGLEAGAEHTIQVEQVIRAPTSDKPLKLVSKQDFFVDAPQFSLPKDSVYSVYPPPAYSEDHRILPHAVLSDPHLPWERIGSPSDDAEGNISEKRNKVPWLALFTFSQDELLLSAGALGDRAFKQTSTKAVKMTVGDLWSIKNVATPITPKLGPESIKDASGDFVFIKLDLFKSLFSTFDKYGKRLAADGPVTDQYKYLSHVRNINTTGMAVAGVEDVGVFSVVIGSRCGPLDNKSPVPVSVHLVSIEGVEAMRNFPDKDFVALCSLHSWNYTVMPPGMLNVRQAFESIGWTLSVLRPPDAVIDSVSGGGKMGARLAARLKDGYSLVRYRLQTGEQTVAMYRGPFTPTVVGPKPEEGYIAPVPRPAKCSNSGQDLQILDREVGIMDISYCAAWQLGRTLALGDQSFAAALSRFRAAIHKRAMKQTKIVTVLAAGSSKSYCSRTDLLQDLSSTVKHLNRIHTAAPGGSTQPPQDRWQRDRLSRHEYPLLHFNARNIKDEYLPFAVEAALDLAKATDGQVYDETNTPVSTDWMVVLAFVLDLMFLSKVPAHYLINDPNHLPPESLRFFYVDPKWVDSLVDGALSLANHSGEDRDRAAIKVAVNAYLTYKAAHSESHTPQVPRYGFYLRSDLVSMFPDLKVTTLPELAKDAHPRQAPLLRHEIVTDGVMLGLLDRQPGSEALTGLVFTQPPHQQRFAAAQDVDASGIQIQVRKQYTVSQTDRQRDETREEALTPPINLENTDPDNWFVWSTEPGSSTNDLRLLRLPFAAEQQLSLLRAKMGEFDTGDGSKQKFFDDDAPTSALLAMQLNDPIYKLTIMIQDKAFPAEPLAKVPRTLASTAPSTVWRPVEPNEETPPPASPPAPSSPSSSPCPLGRHETYTPSPHFLQNNLSPYIRALPPHTPPPSWPPMAGAPGKPAIPPTLTCNVYSSGDFPNVQATQDSLPQDLVFSILVDNNESSGYDLIELDIIVPLGKMDPDRHRLMESYDGPGPRMLTNLRFNVVATTRKSDGEVFLVLRLLPRSAHGYIDAKKVKEMGFLLCLAKPNRFPGEKGSVSYVTLRTEAYYRFTDPRKEMFDIALQNVPPQSL